MGGGEGDAEYRSCGGQRSASRSRHTRFLLEDAERTLFRRLSVFLGGFTLEAAETVCSDCGLRMTTLRAVPDCGLEAERQSALDYLEQLCECSLILAEEAPPLPQSAIRNRAPREAWSSAIPETRYRLLETVREYGWDRLLEAGEASVLRTRPQEWFLALAERAEPELLRADQESWLERLQAECDNLRGAMEWSGENGEAEDGIKGI